MIDLSFAHAWEAEILAERPMILPPRHFVYPREVEEVERGALEVMVRPGAVAGAKAQNLNDGRSPARLKSCPDTLLNKGLSLAQPFLATCALGFRDPTAPTGVWAAPNPAEMCAVAGGYAYVIDTSAPERFTFIALRPVLEVRLAVESGLLLFVGHRNILAWGEAGEAWQSEKLSDEGVTVTGIEGEVLRGLGWDIRTDRETAFELDLRTGRVAAGS